MARAGVCKDRLADAFERFGRVPIVKKTEAVPREHPIFRQAESVPWWASGGLLHDGRGRVLLLKHVPSKGWGDVWLTPGGKLEGGETVLEGFEREVREEVGLGVIGPLLTRIIQQNLTDGSRVRHGYFAQFVARAAAAECQPGSDVLEVRWFDALPNTMAFREDYVEDFRRLVQRP
ncbi:MAG TPA: NUDIX hydrolase [Thermoplasmata archaeon]|nr:NUDIX hydrolase [Thermoplasmata archaeon]